VAVTVNWYVPGVVGVPVRVPCADSDSPGGLPDDTEKVYGGEPPAAVIRAASGCPRVAAGRLGGLRMMAAGLVTVSG
jgi:hypothetical protein